MSSSSVDVALGVGVGVGVGELDTSVSDSVSEATLEAIDDGTDEAGEDVLVPPGPRMGSNSEGRRPPPVLVGSSSSEPSVELDSGSSVGSSSVAVVRVAPPVGVRVGELFSSSSVAVLVLLRLVVGVVSMMPGIIMPVGPIIMPSLSSSEVGSAASSVPGPRMSLNRSSSRPPLVVSGSRVTVAVELSN
jgi:hypothetical protein